MANRRDIKKDIQYLTEQVILDALEMAATLSEDKKEEVMEIIVSVVDLHNNLIIRVNHVDGKETPRLVKMHFEKIIVDLLDGCNKAYNKLNLLIPG